MEIREVTYMAVAMRILAAVIIGGILGLERGMKNPILLIERRCGDASS